MTAATRAKAAGERRRFGMHPALLLDVIRRQAGSLAKAALEGVMNSIDAGCTRCVVEVTADRLVVEDDGSGITDRRAIEEFFETFGRPHTAAEAKTYGTFRMGRGQLMAYGRNLWRTGPFAMDVDVKNQGLDYVLRSDLPPAAGCRVEVALYDRLLPSDLAETVRTVKKWVRYAPVPVAVNGEVASTDPAGEAWDHVLPEAYVRLSGPSQALSVYNLGVHTMDLGGYRYGTGGVVVSRKQLRVNFARNDVQSDCPVWKKVRAVVDTAARTRIAKKPDLTDAERQRLADLVSQGEAPDGAARLKLFTAVNGRHYSAREFRDKSWAYQRRLTACPLGDRTGDRLFQAKAAFVLADVTLTRFGTDLAGVGRVAAGLTHDRTEAYTDLVPFAKLAADFNPRHEIVEPAALTATEKAWLDLADRVYYYLLDGPRWDRSRRKLVVGASDTAAGWTDGETYIALDRGYLGGLRFDPHGVTALGLLLAHEQCHTTPDSGTHVHGVEFYEEFHRLVEEKLPVVVLQALTKMEKVLAAAKKTLPREFLKQADRAARTRRVLEESLATYEKDGKDE